MRKHSWKWLLALLALVLVVGVGAKMYSNVTMGDDEWVGLAYNKGRIVFDDQVTDEINVMNAYVGLGTASPTGMLHLDGPGVGWGIKLTRGTLVAQWCGSNNGPAYFGTESNDDLYLRTNATNRISVLADGKVGINDTTPSYDLDVNGDIRVTDDVTVNDDAFINGYLQGNEYAKFDEQVTASRHESGLNADQLVAVGDMPYAAVTTNKGGYFTYFDENICSDVDLTGLYIANTQTERQAWVRWLVYDITAGTRHDGEATLVFTGTTTSVVIADEGANDLLFKVAEGISPNNDGYLCLDVVGNHSYEVVLMTLWH